MLPLVALAPAPLPAVRQRSRAAFLITLGLRLLLAVAVLGVFAGLITSALWEPGTPADAAPVEGVCPDPPCPPADLPDVEYLPLLVAPLGYVLAALLGVSALVVLLLSGGRCRPWRRALLPVLGPMVVLVAMEVVPTSSTRAWVAGAFGDSLPSGCAGTAHGVDVHDRWHALHHAVVGGLPAALGCAALLRRRRPELFARSDDSPPLSPESAADVHTLSPGPWEVLSPPRSRGSTVRSLGGTVRRASGWCRQGVRDAAARDARPVSRRPGRARAASRAHVARASRRAAARPAAAAPRTSPTSRSPPPSACPSAHRPRHGPCR